MTISFGATKKPLLVVIAGLSVVVLGLLIAVIVLAIPKPEKTTIKDTANYCFKSHCLSAASEILDSINTSVNPCDDFYAHACGSWIKTHRIPPDEKSIGTFKNVRNLVNKRLIGLLQESTTDGEHMAVTKAKTLFQSCMDVDAIDRHSVPIIKEAIALMNKTTNHVDLVNMLNTYGANTLIPAFVGKDPKNVTRNIISVTNIGLILGSKRYYNESTSGFAAFRSMIDGFSDVLIGNSTDEIIDYELNLTNIYTGFSQNASESYNLMTIEELHNHTQNQVEWLKIFQMAINNSGSHVQVNEKTEVLVQSPDYIKKLAGILNATDIKTLINYAAVRYIIRNIYAMPSKYRKLKLSLDKELYSVKAASPREYTCAVYVRKVMPDIVSRLYVDNYFPKSAKKRAILLVQSLREAMEKIFKENKWMDDATRLAAIEKVEAVLYFIGYKEAIKDDSNLGMIFQTINFTKDGFLENVISINMLYSHFLFYGLNTTNNRKVGSHLNAAIVNAFYSPSQNSIIFPAGILQPPLYDEQYPLSMLFGAMGAVVGHEFTHGFDNQGSQYDKIGNLKNWWTQKSLENFRKRAIGLKQQYAKFPICKNLKCDLHINENLTLGENIADNGGVKASFRAYKKYVKDHNIKTMTLPGLSYTSDQLFFVGFAHIWCGKIQTKALIDKLLTNPHSPAIARVIVTLRNSEAFSTAFNCKKDSPMNPTIKYGVW